MYQNNFWDTVNGQHLAETLIHELPKMNRANKAILETLEALDKKLSALTKPKQYVRAVKKKDFDKFLLEAIQRGDRYVACFENDSYPNEYVVIMEN